MPSKFHQQWCCPNYHSYNWEAKDGIRRCLTYFLNGYVHPEQTGPASESALAKDSDHHAAQPVEQVLRRAHTKVNHDEYVPSVHSRHVQETRALRGSLRWALEMVGEYAVCRSFCRFCLELVSLSGTIEHTTTCPYREGLRLLETGGSVLGSASPMQGKKRKCQNES